MLELTVSNYLRIFTNRKTAPFGAAFENIYNNNCKPQIIFVKQIVAKSYKTKSTVLIKSCWCA